MVDFMLLAQLGIREGNLNIVSDPFVASIEKAAKKKKKRCAIKSIFGI